MNLKLDCLNVVNAIRSLMATSLSLVKAGKDVNQILFMNDEKSVQVTKFSCDLKFDILSLLVAAIITVFFFFWNPFAGIWLLFYSIFYIINDLVFFWG